MPQYKIRLGHKLTVPDPDVPGQTTSRVGGDTVELSESDAAEYPDALDLVEAVATPAAQSVAPASDASAQGQ